MPSHRIPLNTIIHQNFSLVMMYAFSQPVLSKILHNYFVGEWKYLNKACFETSEKRANRALLELATQLRLLDDKERLNEYLKSTDHPPSGKIINFDDTESDLFFRDVTNKIMHSSRFEWNFSDPDNPILICFSDDQKWKWKRAEIPILSLASILGGIMA